MHKELAQSNWLLDTSASALNRTIANLDRVTITEVPSSIMKTVYDFTEGAMPGSSAKQIKMFLVHPLAVTHQQL